jgi:hypothetical protein
MYGSERKRRATIGLALFRGTIGVLLVALPWLIGNGLDGYGKTQLACGVAVVAVAALIHRALWLRWVQASLALLVFFLPFAFGDDVSDHQIYCAVLAGKLLLLTAIVSPRLFASDETTASDSDKSSASNTSSVSTPSK